MSVLIDTNILVAAADAGEERNFRARELLEQLSAEDPFTTDHVLVEMWAIIARRAGYDVAERAVTGLRGSPLTIEHVTLVDLERALAIGEVWADQRFDLVDRTSMAVMERLGCRRVATFDRDFAVYRYGSDKGRAFNVVR